MIEKKTDKKIFVDEKIDRDAAAYFGSLFLFTDFINFRDCSNKMELLTIPFKIEESEYVNYKVWRVDEFIHSLIDKVKLIPVQYELIKSYFSHEDDIKILEMSIESLYDIKISFDDSKCAIVFQGVAGLIKLIENMVHKLLNEISFTSQQFICCKDQIKNDETFLLPYSSNMLSSYIQCWVFRKIKAM